MTIHDFDMARFIVDKEIQEVYAKGEAFTDISISKAGDIDTAVIVLKYMFTTTTGVKMQKPSSPADPDDGKNSACCQEQGHE